MAELPGVRQLRPKQSTFSTAVQPSPVLHCQSNPVFLQSSLDRPTLPKGTCRHSAPAFLPCRPCLSASSVQMSCCMRASPLLQRAWWNASFDPSVILCRREWGSGLLQEWWPRAGTATRRNNGASGQLGASQAREPSTPEPTTLSFEERLPGQSVHTVGTLRHKPYIQEGLLVFSTTDPDVARDGGAMRLRLRATPVQTNT